MPSRRLARLEWNLGIRPLGCACVHPRLTFLRPYGHHCLLHPRGAPLAHLLDITQSLFSKLGRFTCPVAVQPHRWTSHRLALGAHVWCQRICWRTARRFSSLAICRFWRSSEFILLFLLIQQILMLAWRALLFPPFLWPHNIQVFPLLWLQKLFPHVCQRHRVHFFFHFFLHFLIHFLIHFLVHFFIHLFIHLSR